MIFKKTCYICKKKSKDVSPYLIKQPELNKMDKVHICRLCQGYAQRRAYFKV